MKTFFQKHAVILGALGMIWALILIEIIFWYNNVTEKEQILKEKILTAEARKNQTEQALRTLGDVQTQIGAMEDYVRRLDQKVVDHRDSLEWVRVVEQSLAKHSLSLSAMTPEENAEQLEGNYEKVTIEVLMTGKFLDFGHWLEDLRGDWPNMGLSYMSIRPSTNDLSGLEVQLELVFYQRIKG